MRGNLDDPPFCAAAKSAEISTFKAIPGMPSGRGAHYNRNSIDLDIDGYISVLTIAMSP